MAKGLTREQLAALVSAEGLEKTYSDIEAIERGQSKSGANEVIPILARLWETPEEWFVSLSDTRRAGPGGKLLVTNEAKALYDVEQYVDIPLHKSILGKVISLLDVTKIKVPAGLAKGYEFGIRVSDLDNAPRFVTGNEVVFRPQEIYNDKCWVAAEHPTEMVEFEGKPYKRIYIRRYVYRTGKGFMLEPLDEGAPIFEANSMKILGLAIARRIEHAEDWITWEIREKGLPPEAP